ncbi:brefeldin a-inhibited guanine nucleotide-exchange protein 2-like, partial [Haematococcus lacustris]
RDEHVYFWFPLLAGLSELTFDPRQEIRASALEVLFDTLMHHGGSFAASFWKRVFYSVLLPIFDHVRAEVTDTTTFTSEKRRQQEDSWLYETCTRCLQHLVDVFVQFYEETKQLLPQLLDLLLGFMNRSHQSLAAVGVAAFVRLVNSAATRMDSNAWATVTNFLMTSTQEICPSAYDLAGVQLLLVQGCSDIYSKQYSCMPPAALCKVLQTLELIASHARGIDMDLDLRKRLAMQQAEDRVAEDRIVADPPLLRLEMEASHAYLSVLLHLMTLANTRDGARLHAASNPGPCMVQLCMAILSRFALGSAGNGVRPDAAYMAEAATRLQQLQASQQAAAEKAAVDAVASAGLSTVFAGVSGRTAAQQRAMAAKMSAVACAAQGKTPDQKSLIVGRTSAGVPVLMATPAVEYAPFAPLVGSALKALGGLDDASFKGHLPQFFPLMTSLIQTDYAPPEVLRVLSDLFAKRVGPIIGVMNATAAMEAAVSARQERKSSDGRQQ